MSARSTGLTAPMRKTLTALASRFASLHYTKSTTGTALVIRGLATFVRGGEYVITDAGRRLIDDATQRAAHKSTPRRFTAAERAALEPLIVRAAVAAVRQAKAEATKAREVNREGYTGDLDGSADAAFRETCAAGKALARALAKLRGGK